MTRRFTSIAIVLLLGLIAGGATAEERLPVDPYKQPEELVTISETTTLRVAFTILNQVAMSTEGKVIVDPAHHEGTVGVAINQLPWRDALELILRANGLWYTEDERGIEIIEPEKGPPEGEADLDQGSREVRIEAVFFEADRQFLRESGIDWTAIKDGMITIRASSRFGSMVSEPMISAGVDGELDLGAVRVDVMSLFNFLESKDKGEIIAQPAVTVRDGGKGRIQVGQDFSIKTTDFAGNTIDNFFSTGTILEVSPRLYKDGDVEFLHLDIEVERSSASPDAVSTVVNKIAASSSVLLLSGESTVIGGLYSTSREVTRKGVPILKDLPPWVLGLRYLFGYNRTEIHHKELIILIRAELLPSLPDRKKEKFLGLDEHLEKSRARLDQRFLRDIQDSKGRARWTQQRAHSEAIGSGSPEGEGQPASPGGTP